MSAPAVARRRRWRLGALAVLLMGVTLPLPAQAHRRIFGTYSLQVDGVEARWTLRLDAVDVGGLMQADANGDGGYSEVELLARRGQIEAYLRERLTLTTDGLSCGEPELTALRADDAIPHWLDFEGTFTCPRALGIVEVGNRALFDFIREYQHFVEFETPAGYVQRILSASRPSIRIRVGEPAPGAEAPEEPGESALAVELPSGALGRIGMFVREGVHHILIGPDHVLFILGLILGAANVRRLIAVVTAFTLAHSITLALASLNVLRIDVVLAESLIALSVATIGLENAVRVPRHRWFLAFAFGLVHGVGFSSVLGELVSITHLDGGARAELLFGFNVGVELGQLGIVAVVFPALWWLRRRRERVARQVVLVTSIGILMAGSYWFVERAFGL